MLIRIKAAGLNRADAAVQAGALDSAVETFFPVVPGWDIAGVVERSGPGTPKFARGDEVIAYVRGDVQRAHGGFAEPVSAGVRSVARKPSTLPFTEAAGLPLATLTAYQGVVHALAVQRGESVLVHGAADGVGSVAVQIAVALGRPCHRRGIGRRSRLPARARRDRAASIAEPGVPGSTDVFATGNIAGKVVLEIG